MTRTFSGAKWFSANTASRTAFALVSTAVERFCRRRSHTRRRVLYKSRCAKSRWLEMITGHARSPRPECPAGSHIDRECEQSGSRPGAGKSPGETSDTCRGSNRTHPWDRTRGRKRCSRQFFEQRAARSQATQGHVVALRVEPGSQLDSLRLGTANIQGIQQKKHFPSPSPCRPLRGSMVALRPLAVSTRRSETPEPGWFDESMLLHTSGNSPPTAQHQSVYR